MSYREEIHSYFNKFSRYYDSCATIISMGTIGRVRKQTVEMLALKKEARVLDLCTGTGETASYLMKAGYRPAGIDISIPMLREAVKKGIDQDAALVHGDAIHLPFGKSVFEGATISFGLHEMPEEVIEDVIRETARVLKPGGKLVVTDWNLPPNPFIRALFNPLIDAFENRYCRNFLETDMICLMLKHGFGQEGQLRIGFGCAAIRSFRNCKKGTNTNSVK